MLGFAFAVIFVTAVISSALPESQPSTGHRIMHEVCGVAAASFLGIAKRLKVTDKVVLNSINCCGDGIHPVGDFLDRPA